MEHLDRGRSPDEIAAEVAEKQRAERDKQIAKERAGLLDLTSSDGRLFMALVRELKMMARSAPAKKRHSLKTETALTLCFYPKPGKDALVLSVPATAEIIRHRGGTYVLTDQLSMRQVRVEETKGQFRFIGCSGFEISHGRAVRRTFYGTKVIARVNRG